MRHPNEIDWIIYRIFRWCWNPIFIDNPRYAFGIAAEIMKWLGAEVKYNNDEISCDFTPRPTLHEADVAPASVVSDLEPR